MPARNQLLAVEESTERGDCTPVELMKRYPIGDEVDLLRVETCNLS